MTNSHIVTFHKAGSNWFRRLFREAADANRINIYVDRPTRAAINTATDYGSDSTMSLYRTQDAPEVLARSQPEDPIVLCIRDPKDILISQYYSWKNTHQNNSQKILDAREKLNEMSEKLGQRWLVRTKQIPYAESIKTWVPYFGESRMKLVKYEDLLVNFVPTMSDALAHVGASLPSEAVAELEQKYSFSAITKREAGTEDKKNHYRKGISGDWKNHFDPKLTELFNLEYGDLCKTLGYEPAAVPA